MLKTKTAVLASVLAALLLLAAVPASAGLTGWQYQREITIHENSGETLYDYQVLVENSGSDFPEESQPHGDDIRFTDTDGHELNYWIEEFDADSKRAKIWVKMPLIPANSEARITLWYGNLSAGRESDGEAVFELFDDFSSGTLKKWKYLMGASITTDASQPGKFGNYAMNLKSPGTGYAKCDMPLMRDVGIRALIKDLGTGPSDSPDADGVVGLRGSDSNSMDGILVEHDTDTGFHFEFDAAGSVDGDYITFNTWEWQELVCYGTQAVDVKGKYWDHGIFEPPTYHISATNVSSNTHGLPFVRVASGQAHISVIIVRQYVSPEPTVTLAPPTIHTALAIAKSPTPHPIRQFQETTINIAIENSGTTDATDIEITDAIHPSFDLTSGDLPNPKRYDLIRPGETHDLQYTIRAKESGTFTLDPATITYADEGGNIQEAKSEPAFIKVIPSTEGSASGGTSHDPSVTTASVQLHGEKTNVVLGEDILLKLSAVNLITKPTMHVQVIIIPPSGMSVTSSAFAKSGAGQYTTTYELEPGTGKDIEVAIQSNQVGDFDVNGSIIYYFGDDREDTEDHTLTLPITVRAEAEQGAERTESSSESKGSSAPGFAAVVAVIGLLAAYARKRS